MYKRTPRQELIDDAVTRARNGKGAHMALESVIDDCKRYDAGTLAAAIVAYYRGISEYGLERLIKAVETKFEEGNRYADYLDWISDEEPVETM